MNVPFGIGSGGSSGLMTLVAPETADLPSEDGSASLVDQLAALYQEKQELQASLGVSTSSEIIELFRSQQSDSMVASLTAQLTALYSDHDELRAAIGVSTPSEIIRLVFELRSSIRVLVDESRRRLAYEATLLETHERYLS